MTETAVLLYFDNAGLYHKVLQVWAGVPGTGVSFIVSVQEIEVDPASIPSRPTRPA